MFLPTLQRVVEDYTTAVHEELKSPLADPNEVNWFFFHRRRGTDWRTCLKPDSDTMAAKVARCLKAYHGPRFALLYRRCLVENEAALTPVSPRVREALAAGRAGLECVVLPYDYEPFSPLVRKRRRRRRRATAEDERGATYPTRSEPLSEPGSLTRYAGSRDDAYSSRHEAATRGASVVRTDASADDCSLVKGRRFVPPRQGDSGTSTHRHHGVNDPGAVPASPCEAVKGRSRRGVWSKGRNGRFAYYHCRGECRDINIAKAKLEGLFVDELSRLQPSAGYMRLVKERVVQAWDRAKSDVKEKAEAVERRIKAIRQRIDRLDNACLYEQSIDIDTYDRHKERLNEELTLARMDRQRHGARRNGRRGHPGLRRARFTARRGPLVAGRRSHSASAFSSCFSRKGLCSTEKSLFEPL